MTTGSDRISTQSLLLPRAQPAITGYLRSLASIALGGAIIVVVSPALGTVS
jgi:hypothetical protein